MDLDHGLAGLAVNDLSTTTTYQVTPTDIPNPRSNESNGVTGIVVTCTSSNMDRVARLVQQYHPDSDLFSRHTHRVCARPSLIEYALIEYALDQEYPFIVRSETTTRKGYYRLLYRHILDPLDEQGYIQFKQIGREKLFTSGHWSSYKEPVFMSQTPF